MVLMNCMHQCSYLIQMEKAENIEFDYISGSYKWDI